MFLKCTAPVNAGLEICRALHGEYSQLLDTSPWHVAQIGEGRGVYRVLVGKPEGKRPLGRPRRRWEDNIKMDLQEVGCGCMDWIELAQEMDKCRVLVNAVIKCGEVLD
jgi:hypothetical protein